MVVFLQQSYKPFFSFDECAGNAVCLSSGLLFENYEIGWHEHDFFELNVVLDGRGTHFVHDRRFAVRRGDVFVIPPGYRHGYANDEGLSVYHLIIRPIFFAKYHHELSMLREYIQLFQVEPTLRREGRRFAWFLKLDDRDLEQLDCYLKAVLRESSDLSPEAPLTVNYLTLCLITLLCRHYRQQRANTPETEAVRLPLFRAVLNSISYMYEHYTKSISLDELFGVAGLSRPTFMRLFKVVTGTSPISFLNEYRVTTAKRMLLETSMTVTDIGYAVGFYDTPHFVRTFKKCVRMTPAVYRRMYVKERDDRMSDMDERP